MHFRPNKSSFHYRLLHWWYREEYFMPRDFCTYWRAVIWLTAIGCAVAYVVISPALLLLMGLPTEGEIGVRVIAFLVFCLATLFALGFAITYAILVVIYHVSSMVMEKRSKQRGSKSQTEGLLKTKYKAWKGKYCPKVTYD